MSKEPNSSAHRNPKTAENKKRADKQPSKTRPSINVEQSVVDAVKAQHHPKEQHRDGYDRANLVFMGLTFVAALAAAVFTGWLAYLTQHLAQDSERLLDASTRASIAVTGVKFDGTPEVGKNQRLKILFKNVGKEAAADFSLFAIVSDGFNFEPDSAGMPYIEPALIPWPLVQDCRVPEGHKVIGARPVYPDVPNEGITYAFNPGPGRPKATFVPQRLLDGKMTFYVVGCAYYRSLDKPRHSPFCFYYQPVRGGDVNKGTFEWCPAGSGNAS